jgi:MFS family permease
VYTSVRGGPEAAAREVAAAETPGMGASAPRRAVGATVLLLGLTSLFTDVSAEMVTAVLPVFLTLQVGLSPMQFGFVDGLYQGVTALVRLLGGYAADRWGRPKAVAATGYGLSAVCKLALLPAGSLSGVSAVIAADRTGKGLRTAPRDALIAASSRPDAYGRAFGVHRTLDTFGAMLGPLVASALLAANASAHDAHDAYDTVFVTSFCFALVGLAIIVLFVPEHRVAVMTGRQVTVRASAGLLRDRAFARLAVAATALGLLTVSDGFLYLSLLRRDDVVTAVFPLLFFGTSASYLLLAMPFGWLADRIGRRVVFVGGHLALLGCYATVVGPVTGLLAAGACLLLLGAYYAATDGVLAAAAAPLLPEHMRSTGLATLQTLVALARFASSVAFGALWTTVGLSWAYALVAGGLLAVLPVAAVLLRAPRPKNAANTVIMEDAW